MSHAYHKHEYLRLYKGVLELRNGKHVQELFGEMKCQKQQPVLLEGKEPEKLQPQEYLQGYVVVLNERYS